MKTLDIMSTYHDVQNQGKLIMQSREKMVKNLNLSNFLTISRPNISKLQIAFIQIESHT